MKKPLVVNPRVFLRLSALPKADRDECWDALEVTFPRNHDEIRQEIRSGGNN